MEAAPRLPMVSFDLKISTENVSFGPKLKQYIAGFYHEDPESYNNEIHNLEVLRATAVRPTLDVTGCQTLKKYYCQLNFLKSRFPMEKGQTSAVSFSWKDLYAGLVSSVSDIDFELCSVLYNIGVLHTQLGANDTRSSGEGMKMSCTHFQCAAWAFQHLKDNYPHFISLSLAPEVMHYMYQLSLAQAQECILEKSMMDNRKSTIIAKVAVQVVDYYNQALTTLMSGSDEAAVSEIVGIRMFKEWSRYIKFKIAYNSSISLLYQGQQSEEQQKMGERVAYYQAASEQLEEARKTAKGNMGAQQHEVDEALAFTTDVVEGKKKAAKNENEFIYHEVVPERDALQQMYGASLVKGIPFSVNDRDVSGPDLFQRLVPMEAHEASSVYSEQKAEMLRQICAIVDSKDSELAEFMSSLQLECLNQWRQAVGVPQEVVDRAAAICAKPHATHALVEVMGRLASTCHEVETQLSDIQELIKDEEAKEKEYQTIMGSRPPSIVSTDLSREAGKYNEAHSKANESNQTLHRAMTTHMANLKVLAQPLPELKKAIPSAIAGDPAIEDKVIQDLESLIAKVEEMRAQRSTLIAQLREAVCADDITALLVTKPPNMTMEQLFQRELNKHKRQAALIEQNLAAQENILSALTDTYARFASTRRHIAELLKKRETITSALIASYDAYDDLLAKANKGIEFYQKLEGNVQKLQTRVKSACRVNEEEREQMLAKTSANASVPAVSSSATPKLKDYLASMRASTDNAPWSVRPAPLGSEETSDKRYDSQTYYNQTQQYQYPASGANYYNTTTNTAPTTTASFTYPEQYYNYNTVSEATNPNYQLPPTYAQSVEQIQPATYQNYAKPEQVQNYQNYAPKPEQSYQNYAKPEQSQNYQSYAEQSKNYAPKLEQAQNYTPKPDPSQSYTPNPEQSQSYAQKSDQNYATYSKADNQSYHNYNVAIQTPINQVQTPYIQKQDQPQNYTSYTPTPNNYQTPYIPDVANQNYNPPAYSSKPDPYSAPPTYSAIDPAYSYTPDPSIPPQPYSVYYPPTDTNGHMQSQNHQTSSGYYAAVDTNTMPSQPQQNYQISSTYSASVDSKAPSQHETYLSPRADYSSYQSDQCGTPKDTSTYSTNYGYPINYHSATTEAGYNQNQPVDYTYQYSQHYYPTTYPVTQTFAPTVVELNLQYTNAGTHSTSQTNSTPSVQAESSNQQEIGTYYTSPYGYQTIGSNSMTMMHANTNIDSSSKNTSSVSSSSNVDLLAGLDFTIDQAPLTPQVKTEAAVKKEPEAPVVTKPEIKKEVIQTVEAIPEVIQDPLADLEALAVFSVEVEKLEKIVDGLTTKTLNGPTPLDIKWKEIQEQQERDTLCSISVARCYPMKNRFPDIMPYDHTRVELPSTKDDYINASYIRNITIHAPPFIITQAPLKSTLDDFWTMIFEQQIEVLVCLLADSEIKEDSYWPSDRGGDLTVGRFKITLQSMNASDNWIERILSITDGTKYLIVVHLQFISWPGSGLFPTSVAPLLALANAVLGCHRQQRVKGRPVVVHCLSGVGRSGVLCALIAAICNPVHMLDVSAAVSRMSQSRKNVLRDREHLKFTYQAVLQHFKDLVNGKSLEKRLQNVSLDETPSRRSSASDIAVDSKQRKKFTPESFGVLKEQGIIPPPDTSDPLSALDPLWTMKK